MISGTKGFRTSPECHAENSSPTTSVTHSDELLTTNIPGETKYGQYEGKKGEGLNGALNRAVARERPGDVCTPKR